MMCECGAVEDELHFMTVCSRYVAERNEMVRAIRETTNTRLVHGTGRGGGQVAPGQHAYWRWHACDGGQGGSARSGEEVYL